MKNLEKKRDKVLNKFMQKKQASLKNNMAKKEVISEVNTSVEYKTFKPDMQFIQQNLEKLIKLPLLALKDLSPFPGMVMPIFVGRKKSIEAINYANATDRILFLVSQKDPSIEEIEREDLVDYGVLAEIKQLIILQDKTLKVLLECNTVGKLESIEESLNCGWEAKITLLDNVKEIESEEERLALKNTLKNSFDKFLKSTKASDVKMMTFLETMTNLFEMVYYIAERIQLTSVDKQKLLEINDERAIIEFMVLKIDSLLKIVEIERRLKNRLKNQIEKNQKDYYLTEQMKAIQKELGEVEDIKEEQKKLEAKIKEVKLSEHARDTALAELKKLKHMNQFSAEFSMIKNYLEFLLDLPWGIETVANDNLEEIKASLNESHFGIEEVKERVYELIVQRNRVKESIKSPVLCFYGAPGIGKTSFAYAIGKAMGLKTISIPLGGVKDESVLRGHRRTYIGSMPGKIIQAIKDAGSSSLVIVLDEIGSMGTDLRGNPEDVLLEILDTMQNKNFQDNYLATGFDLSKIIFIATTNYVDSIKPALLDRLEIISLSGYTQEEKEKIAIGYILPKCLKEYGLKEDQIILKKEELNEIIRKYTYEAGVRGLEQQLSKIIRKAMCIIEEKKIYQIEITKERIKEFLKKTVYSPEEKREPRVGTVNGLGYVGKREGQEGEILLLESTLVPGDGKVEHTGNLGNMMKESIQIAYKKILSKAEEYKIDLEELKKKNMYLNFPSGGIPKDGPSAGVAIFCSMYSTLKNIKFPNDVAMTGEISLNDVLKVGGIKEKLLAAYRNDMKKVFIPYENNIDLEDISKEVLSKMEVILIRKPEEVLKNLGLLA